MIYRVNESYTRGGGESIDDFYNRIQISIMEMSDVAYDVYESDEYLSESSSILLENKITNALTTLWGKITGAIRAIIEFMQRQISKGKAFILRKKIEKAAEEEKKAPKASASGDEKAAKKPYVGKPITMYRWKKLSDARVGTNLKDSEAVEDLFKLIDAGDQGTFIIDLQKKMSDEDMNEYAKEADEATKKVSEQFSINNTMIFRKDTINNPTASIVNNLFGETTEMYNNSIDEYKSYYERGKKAMSRISTQTLSSVGSDEDKEYIAKNKGKYVRVAVKLAQMYSSVLNTYHKSVEVAANYNYKQFNTALSAYKTIESAD